FHLEQLGILLGQGVFRLGENLHQRSLIQLVQRSQNRQATHELWNQTELDQIVRLDFTQGFTDLLAFFLAAHFGVETDAALSRTVLDNLFQTRERAAADEEDVPGVNLKEFLLRMLATTLRRNGSDRAFDQLEQGLLHAFTGNIPGD